MVGRNNCCEATGRKEGTRLRIARVNELFRIATSGSRKASPAKAVAGRAIDMYKLRQCLCVDTRVLPRLIITLL